MRVLSQFNHVAIEGPVTRTKWSHIPITFSIEEIKLASFSHTDAMVVTVHIDRWDVTRVLVANGSQVEVLFLSAFEKIGYDRRQLKESTNPLYGFGEKRIEPVDISPSMLNTFKAALHSAYLCLTGHLQSNISVR
jgi:hypothetical protein